MSEEIMKVPILPPSVNEARDKIPEEYFEKDVDELRALSNPREVDYLVKISFWKYYHRAEKTGGAVELAKVCRGICSKTYFRERLLRNPAKCAWLLSPSPNYISQLEALSQMGYARYKDLLNLPVKDPKSAGVLLAAIKNLDERLKGLPVQRHENKSLNIKIDAKNMLDLDARIQELNMALEGKGTIRLKEDTGENIRDFCNEDTGTKGNEGEDE